MKPGRSLAGRCRAVTSSPSDELQFCNCLPSRSKEHLHSTPRHSLSRSPHHAVYTVHRGEHVAPDSRHPIASNAAAISPWLQDNSEANGSSGKATSTNIDTAHGLTVN